MADTTAEVDDLADGQPGPDKEPKSAKAWLAVIKEGEKAFKDYQDRSDNIDKLYANLEKLANKTRDREFQMFWANVQVLGPAIYSRPPVPVVVPRFKDRRALPRVTSELLERATVVMFELEDVDSVMRLIRDDLTVLARGCAWVRYEAAGEYGSFSERVCIEFVDRKDWLSDPARYWKEVDWVARASYLTKKAMRKRFRKTSADEYQKAAYEERKDEETDDGKLKAKVWEIWSKSQNRVVWVSEGCEKLLDDGPPHLTLEGFFPCPRPAYATVQRRSLVPVPDMVFYKDQLEEINELTARIGALVDALQVRGFYPAGAGEIGDAIEAAVKSRSNNQILVPVSNWSVLGGSAPKDTIVWLPIEQIATVITECVTLRKELIDDVYQITGLSDIMRGSSEASETLGAQELKSQYGSMRIRDRQAEMVRVARDITRITAEIMAENFQADTLLEMSQLEIPTDAQLKQQAAPLQQQLAKLEAEAKQAATDPEVHQMAQQDPQKAQQVMQQVQQQAEQLQAQIAKIMEQPSVEQVMQFLHDQKLRPFVLDIETDSTIAPDENATKQRATEFVTAVGGFIAQALPTVEQVPQSATFMAETLKYIASQFRAGRQLEGAIDEFADQMKTAAQQPKPPSPEVIKAQSEAQNAQAMAQKNQAEGQRAVMEAQTKAANEESNRKIRETEARDASQAKAVELQGKQQLIELDLTQKRQKHAQDMDIGHLTLEKTFLEVERIKAEALAPAEPAEVAKPPSESIAYKDIPPDAQSQMLAQAGIDASPDDLAAHAEKTAADAAALKQASKPKKEPAQ